MNHHKLALILRDKRDELLEKNRPPEGYKGMAASNLWAKYLKKNKIRKAGLVELVEMANQGELQGKS